MRLTGNTPMRRLIVACVLLMATVLLLISPARAATWTATVTTLDLIAGPTPNTNLLTRTAAILSPDGSRFIYIKGNDICLYSIDGEKGECVTLDKGATVDMDSVRWSPDGTKLAFSEDFIDLFRDSDIWLYDVTTNQLTDLTPMPNRRLKVIGNTDPTIIYTVDMIPQWSLDSQSLYFIRYSFNQGKDARPDFYKINLKDNSTEEIARVDAQYAITTYALVLSPDNTQLAYNIDTQGRGKDGIWFLDIATKKANLVAAPVENTIPSTYQYSLDGKLLLVIGRDRSAATHQPKSDASRIYTLPVSGGRQQNLNNDMYVDAAGWGPKGSDLAYTTYDPLNKDKDGLYITEQPGQIGDLVLPGHFIAPSFRGLIPLFWAANSTLLLSQAPDFKLTVVHLSES